MLPKIGILGVAIAYLISQILNLFLKLLLAKRIMSYSVDGRTRAAVFRGAILVFAIALVVASSSSEFMNWLAVGIFLAIWIMASWSDPGFKALSQKLLARFGFLAAK